MKSRILSFVVATAMYAEPSATPAMGLSVNGASAARIEPGWPVMVAVAFAAGDEPALLALREGAWREAVKVTAAAPDGQVIELAWTVREQADRAGLKDLDMVSVEFHLSPEATRQLAAGTYRVRAVFDAQGREAEGAWAGPLTADGTFRVSQDPPDDEAAYQAGRLLLFSHWSEQQGDREKALVWVDELLAAQPAHHGAKVRKSELLEAAGQWSEALALLDEVEVALRAEHPDASHPPTLIHRRQAALLAKMLAGETGDGGTKLRGVRPRGARR